MQSANVLGVAPPQARAGRIRGGFRLMDNAGRSAFGRGWRLAGLAELYPDEEGAMLLMPGRRPYYYELEEGSYQVPEADFATLEREAGAQGGWLHTEKDGMQMHLDAGGRMDWAADRNGNRTSYRYDSAGRLVRVVDPVGRETRLSYAQNYLRTATDPAGRVTRNLSDGTMEQTYTYIEDSNRLDVREILLRNHDGTGLQAQSARYEYNDAGRLWKVYEANELRAEYLYNAKNQRKVKLLYSEGNLAGEIIYHYDQIGMLIAETDNEGRLLRDYIWMSGVPIAQIEPRDIGEYITYLHTDHLYTPRRGTNASGEVVWIWESDAFGAQAPTEAPDSDSVHASIYLRFSGQYHDNETGLYYNWNRYYESPTGRYLTADPIGLPSRFMSKNQRKVKLLYEDDSLVGEIIYHYDKSGMLIAETDDEGEVLRDYIWINEVPVAQIEPNGSNERISYLHVDHLKTPRRATSEDGTVTWGWESDAFGTQSPDEDVDDDARTNIRLRFLGQYHDIETGLHYNWYRYYSPSLGRYLQSEPIRFGNRLNTFNCVDQNPLSWIDFNGLCKCGPGVKCVFSQALEIALACLEGCLGRELTLTSGWRIGERRGKKFTDHGRSQAVDIGENTNPGICPKKMRDCYMGCFPKGSYGQREYNRKDDPAAGTHYHLQTNEHLYETTLNEPLYKLSHERLPDDKIRESRFADSIQPHTRAGQRQ